MGAFYLADTCAHLADSRLYSNIPVHSRQWPRGTFVGVARDWMCLVFALMSTLSSRAIGDKPQSPPPRGMDQGLRKWQNVCGFPQTHRVVSFLMIRHSGACACGSLHYTQLAIVDPPVRRQHEILIVPDCPSSQTQHLSVGHPTHIFNCAHMISLADQPCP